MKNLLLSLSLCLAVLFHSNAQQSLEFNQAILVDDVQQTVPAGKVWKITGISGGARNFCIDIPSSTFFARANGIGFYVNGILMGKMSSTSNTHWTSSDCSTGSSCCAGSFGTIGENGDMVPMWLPAGTTLSAVAPEILLSVIEFNIIP